MVTSVRITAIGDTPDGVKRHFDEVLRRVGLGIGSVTEEVIQRMKPMEYEGAPKPMTVEGEAVLGLGWEGRMKVVWDVPLNAEQDTVWFRGGDVLADMPPEYATGTFLDASLTGGDLRRDTEMPFEVTMHVAHLNGPTLAQALSHRPYRTLIVGTTIALDMARQVIDWTCEIPEPLIRDRARVLSPRIDEGHDPDRWTVTTEVVEP